jgi:hypothetical protein
MRSNRPPSVEHPPAPSAARPNRLEQHRSAETGRPKALSRRAAGRDKFRLKTGANWAPGTLLVRSGGQS